MAEFISVETVEARFEQVVARVEAGESFEITRNGLPIARICPVTTLGKRQFGAMRGKIAIGPEFFKPLPHAEWPFD